MVARRGAERAGYVATGERCAACWGIAQGCLASAQGWAEANLANASPLPLRAAAWKGLSISVCTLYSRAGCPSVFFLVTQSIPTDLSRQLSEGSRHISIILFLLVTIFESWEPSKDRKEWGKCALKEVGCQGKKNRPSTNSHRIPLSISLQPGIPHVTPWAKMFSRFWRFCQTTYPRTKMQGKHTTSYADWKGEENLSHQCVPVSLFKHSGCSGDSGWGQTLPSTDLTQDTNHQLSSLLFHSPEHSYSHEIN